MKIHYSTVRFPPARGGVESYVKTMADEMSHRGHIVAVETSDFSQHIEANRNRLPLQASDDLPPYSVHRSRWTTVPGIGAYPLSHRTIPALLRGRADVIHAHCFYYWSLDAAAVAARLSQSAFVVSPSLPVRVGRKWAAYRTLFTKLADTAHVTTVLSEFERTLLIQSGFRPNRLIQVPPAVALMTDVPRWTAQDECRFDPERHSILLFVGRVTDTKGIGTLISALPAILRAFPEARLCLAGPVSSLDAERFRRLTGALGVTAYVYFAGEISASALAQWYGHSTVFVFPSTYEAFGIVALEAMAAGLPAVVASGSALPEVVGFGARGLVHDVGDARSLADAVLRLLADQDLAAELSAAGRSYVEAAHSATAQGDRLEEVYQLALAAHRRVTSPPRLRREKSLPPEVGTTGGGPC
jgi:glycosyltransferase involved in cell wall biosynthesis